MKKITWYLLWIALVAGFQVSCEQENSNPNSAEALEGEWKVDEDSQIAGSTTYWVYISLAPQDSTRIYISNFYGLGPENEVTGTIRDGRVNLTANQVISALNSDYTVLSGTGQVSSSYQSIQWE